MNIFVYLVFIFLLVNTLAALITIFKQPRNISSIFAWVLTLLFLPGIGFIIYAFCGRGIDQETKNRFKKKFSPEILYLEAVIKNDNKRIPLKPAEDLSFEVRGLHQLLNNLSHSPLTRRNDIQIYTDGKEKFEGLFEDIRQAKTSVHVEYYAFFNDKIGNRFLRLLEEKVSEGLEVRLLFDPWGSSKANKQFFAKFIDLGGQVTPFITSKNLIRKTRLNYHLHRKIVVIDGKIGWTGGFNVGDQYLGESKKFGYWRDTHARIIGTAVFSLQEIFIRDWNASISDKKQELVCSLKYFVLPGEHEIRRNIPMQIVADGPDSVDEILKNGFIKMILSAQKTVWIQTPYLVPDDSMVTALLIASQSGVDVRIMIPSMPDHPFIYRATQYYAGYFQKKGIKIYIYENGFLHSKTIVVDDEICTIGSANQDIRSYALNFEVNAFIYDPEIANKLARIFLEDIDKCTLLTDEKLKNQTRWLRFKQNFSRLLSPIL